MTTPDPARLREIVDRLENYYDFECTGGPLKNCVGWQELRAAVSAQPDRDDPLHTGDDARVDCVTAIRSALEEIVDEEGKPECDHCADLIDTALTECDKLDALLLADRWAGVGEPAPEQDA